MVSSLSLFLGIRIPIGSEFKAYMGTTARSITTAGVLMYVAYRETDLERKMVPTGKN
jgi:hypothetical protein